VKDITAILDNVHAKLQQAVSQRARIQNASKLKLGVVYGKKNLLSLGKKLVSQTT